ncbi:MAG: hypothetical protein HY288_17055 [Planctomycetia bacterium]|nr:hypothetical protein [Planctomycetia bacterium]
MGKGLACDALAGAKRKTRDEAVDQGDDKAEKRDATSLKNSTGGIDFNS